jgi:hypothetical protein
MFPYLSLGLPLSAMYLIRIISLALSLYNSLSFSLCRSPFCLSAMYLIMNLSHPCSLLHLSAPIQQFPTQWEVILKYKTDVSKLLFWITVIVVSCHQFDACCHSQSSLMRVILFVLTFSDLDIQACVLLCVLLFDTN